MSRLGFFWLDLNVPKYWRLIAALVEIQRATSSLTLLCYCFNRQLAVAMLEWLSDEIAEGRGQNVLDVEVLWAPAEEGGRLDLEDLHTKWPELREI